MRKRNGSNLAFLWRFASKYKWELLLAFFSSLIYVGCNIFVPIACGYALDNLKAGDDVTNLTILAIGVCTVLAFVFYWLLSYLSFDVSFKMQRDIRNQAMNKLIDADISSLDQSSSGDQIVVLITDITIISDGVSQMFIQLFTGVFTVGFVYKDSCLAVLSERFFVTGFGSSNPVAITVTIIASPNCSLIAIPKMQSTSPPAAS